MYEDAPSLMVVILADEVTSGQVAVPLEAFAEFCVRMELELEVFEARFAAFALPRAPRPEWALARRRSPR